MKKSIVLGSSVFALALTLFLGFQVRDAYGTACGIGNIQKSFDPLACEVTITWTTSVSTDTNHVHWGQSGCVNPSYPYSVSGTNGTSHTAVIDVTDHGPKINFKVASSSASCSEESGCNTATSGPCIAE
jgi:hypothetical protein